MPYLDGATGQVELHDIGEGNAAHAARSANDAGNSIFFFDASARKAGSRQLGTELFMFQPDTVEMGRSRALATLTVPPSSPMKSLTVMPLVLRIS